MAAVPPGSAEDLDPLVELKRSAVRLVAACEADPANAVLAKELRATLSVIPPVDAAGDPLEVAAQNRLGWSPGADPELRALAASLLEIDPLAYARYLSDQVP